MVEISINTKDKNLFMELKSFRNDDFRIKRNPSIMRSSAFADQTINLTLTLLTSVSASLFANWLYDKLKNKDVSSLEISGQKIEVDEEIIKGAIQ
jgi:hypothetical protein